MAGLGRRTFAAGEVLTAGNVMGYLQDQAVMNFAGTAARGSAIGSAVSQGMVSYLDDSNSLEVYKTVGTAVAGWEPVNLAQSPNVIINGAFDIWQRGTSITPASGYGYGADRWRIFSYASSSSTLARQTFTPGAAPVAGYEGEFFMRVTATNNRIYLTHPVENVRTFAGQTVTLSFWAKSASTHSVDVGLAQNFGSGGSADVTTATQNFSVTTSWQRFTATFSLPSISGKTIGANNYLEIIIIGVINNALDLWGVQLEAGSTATPFRRNANSIQGELAACQRYYYRNSYSGSVGENFYCWLGTRGGSSTTLGSVSLPVEMRAVPTISMSGLAFKQLSGGNVPINNTVTYNPSSKQTASFECARTSGTWSGESQGLLYGGSGSYIDFSAEL